MVSAWNNAKTNTTLQVAKALRLELKKSDNDNSSVLVQAQRRIAGAVLTARSMSQLAMGHLVAAMLDAEAGVDCAPELALVHVRLGEVYEACGGREAAVRVFQRAAALSPNSVPSPAIGGGAERPRVERRGDPRVGLRDAFARVERVEVGRERLEPVRRHPGRGG